MSASSKTSQSKLNPTGFSLDPRSLAVFRVAIGTILLGDLWIRSLDLAAHYSDTGILPRLAWRTVVAPERLWSLHALSGAEWWQGCLFVVAALAAFAFTIGYRTRLFAAVSWVLLLSLQNRNPFILQGGDVLLRLALLYACLLPVHAAFSVDSFLAKENLSAPAPLSDARASWFTALCFAGQIASVYWCAYALKTGPDWRQNDFALYRVLHIRPLVTPFGIWLRQFEFFLPELQRLVLMAEGWLPLLLFMPGRLAGPCRGLALTLFILMHLMFALCLRLGPFPWVCIAVWLAFIPSQWWQKWPRVRCPAPATSGAAVKIFAALALTYATLWNAKSLGFSTSVPGTTALAITLGLDQRWDMFAASPPQVDTWYVATGTLADGRVADVLSKRVGLPDWSAPTEVGETERWRKLYMALRDKDHEGIVGPYADYLCRTWNQQSSAQDFLVAYQLFAVSVPTGIGSQVPEKVRLLERVCL